MSKQHIEMKAKRERERANERDFREERNQINKLKFTIVKKENTKSWVHGTDRRLWLTFQYDD